MYYYQISRHGPLIVLTAKQFLGSSSEILMGNDEPTAYEVQTDCWP